MDVLFGALKTYFTIIKLGRAKIFIYIPILERRKSYTPWMACG